MTFTELVQEVYTLTGRPDRVAETNSAVRSATLKAHQSDYYWRDILEFGISFTAAEYLQNLDYRSIMPRWRALKYLRKYDITSGTPGMELSIVLPDNVFDDYGLQKDDICYGAGAYIQINSSTQEQNYLCGAYLNPDTNEATYDSWVALDQPWFIIYDAAATVFRAIGKDEESAAYRQIGQEQLAMLKTTNILAQGF